ncbi:LCP family protein [Nonomuraea sp. LPB2021202275-12-8]|uniref:LCP family protein n=1 Tax=Nonomuraea sp. LPB2021202275-12-8 TaxID=3120159 RepID=UPI00300C849C
MSKRDGVDAVPGGRKRRPPRRPRPAANKAPAPDPGSAAAAGKAAGAGGSGVLGRLTAALGGGKAGDRGRAGRPGNTAPRFTKPVNLASVLGWTVLSILVPGAAHLRAGHRRTGLILVSVYAAVLLGALAFVLLNLDNLGIFVRGSLLMTVTVMAALAALSWFALVISSYVSLRPNRLNQQAQIVSGIVVGVLCVAVMAPFALAATALQTTKDAIEQIFPSGNTDPDIAPIKEEDPWNGKDRVNFLLIGGDAASNRTGVRTDSMNVASVHIPTGTTVLFSLPRNLQHVRFPPSSPLRKQFPNGYMAELHQGGLLNEVWQYANDHPDLAGGRNKGPRALMDAIGYTLGLKIDYYAMMNMYGFADLVDAIGGLKIRVEEDVKWGGLYGTAGTIKAGYRRLSGEEALWYGRSRVNSDDFNRMGRQRCVIGAFAQQATPDKILTNFTDIARATKRLAQTNIPKELVEPLVSLALKVKNAKISSLQFVPPEYWPGSADWPKIRRAATKAVQDSLKPARRARTADVTASPGAPTATASPTGAVAAKPTATPTRNSQKAGAKSIEELCGL